MPQITKIVDLTRSFVVTDPNSFPQNMMFTKQEDAPEESLPVLAFDGYNFLPTAYGIRSYFGTNSTLNIQPLPSRCDDILLYQFANYQNVLVALCEDGIYISHTSIAGSVWDNGQNAQAWNFSDWLGGKGFIAPAESGLTPVTHKRWTYTTIENKLYMYQEGTSNVYSITPTSIDLVTGIVTLVIGNPTFLNMAGQMGIFRANGRLGFWDSVNSVSWSSLFDMMDLTPSLETLAGNSIFNAVIGRIVTILPQGDGFVIYTTKGIVGVRYSSVANILWDAAAITDSAGIIYPFQVCRGLTELEHFAFTSSGIKRIGSYNALNKSHTYEEVLTDVYDSLKESRTPVKLSIINGRYLCFQVIDASYIDGKTLFTYNTIDSVPVRVLINDGTWDGITVLPEFINGQTVQSHIAGQLNSGWHLGMYLQWHGTLRPMFAEVTTSESFPYYRKTPVVPYSTDISGVHIPNSPIDTSSSWYHMIGYNYTDASELNILTQCDPVGGDLVEYALGAWTYPGLGNTGSAFKGIVDTSLNEMISTQLSEWANVTLIQAANKIAIEALIPFVDATVPGGTPYYSSAAAQAQIDILVAAGGGTGNSYTVSEDLIGSFISGAGTTAAGILTGVGTNYATYSRTRTFLGGWDVKRRTTRTYSIRSVTRDVVGFGYYVTAGNWGSAGSWSVPPPTTAISFSFGEGSTADIARREAMLQIIAQLPATFSATDGSGTIYNASTPVFPLGASAITWTVSFPQSPPYPYIGTGFNLILRLSGTEGFTSTVTEYFVDYADTTTIPPLTVNPTITLDSTMTAFQQNLTWGYIFLGTPPGVFTSGYGAFSIPGTSLAGASLGPLDVGVTYPGSTFLLQDGSPAPLYPDYAGALVLDLGLKKWGKMKATYRLLLDYQPVNDSSQPVTYTNFGMDIGMLAGDGSIKLFDSHPADSWIRYGKLGYYRLGMTQLHEVKVHFKNSSTGTVELESSFDGRALELVQKQIHYYSSVANTTVYSDQIGRWHTIKITGNYDLTYLEVRGTVAGRR